MINNKTILFQKALLIQIQKFIKLKKIISVNLKRKLIYSFIKYFIQHKIIQHTNIFHILFYKKSLFLKKINSFFYNYQCKFLILLKLYIRKKVKLINFYSNKKDSCGIVRAHFNFSNIFIILTNLKGEIVNWVSGGSGGFQNKLERGTSSMSIALTLRISNLIRKKKFKYLKLKETGPSREYRGKVSYTLQNRAWIRRYKLVCIEEHFLKSFNGCRLRKPRRV